MRKFCDKNILAQREIRSLEINANAVITGLFNSFVQLLFHENKGFRDRGKSLISHTLFYATLHEHLIQSGETDFSIEKAYENFDVKDFNMQERLRLIRDFVAGMTDKYALTVYRRLSGQQIS